MKTAIPAWAATLTLLLGACSTHQMSPDQMSRMLKGLEPVNSVDLPRMMGDWHVFAHIPYWAEKGAYGPIERYTMQDDGRIATDFIFRKGAPDGPIKSISSRATVLDTKSRAVWQIQIFGILKLPYVIIGLDSDYQWAVIGYPDRKLGWVLTRSADLPDATYEKILDLLKQQGYDPEMFRRTPPASLPVISGPSG